MFQIFDSTAVQNNIHQENNVTARKHEISKRKPLKDIEQNKNINGENVSDTQTLKNNKENDLKIDGYKNVADKYKDVMGPTNIDLLKKTKLSVTPPPFLDFDIEDPTNFEFNFDMTKKHEISKRKHLKDIEQNININGENVLDIENDFKIDICSYKDVPDTYNDVMAPTNIDLLNKTNDCVTPPPLIDFEEPDIFEFNDFKFCNVELDLQEILCALRMPDNLC